MKQFSLVLTGGKTVTYNKNDIGKLEEAYEDLKTALDESNPKFLVIRTDNQLDETLVNVNHLIGINAQFD